MSRFMLRTLVLLALILAACTPTPTPIIPTPFVLPSPVSTTVPTAVPPSRTPRPTVTPTFTPTPTRPRDTPTPTFTATPPGVVIESVTLSADVLQVGTHGGCQPQTADVRAVVRSVGEMERVTISWAYEGRVFRPGPQLEQSARADWTGALGPFEQEGTVNYFVTARDVDGEQVVSEMAAIQVIPCNAPPPSDTPSYLSFATATPTPPYGEAASIHTEDQFLTVASGTSVTVTLTWYGGFGPYTLDVFPPQFGTISGMGPVQTYTAPADFLGQDSFAFRVIDANQQEVVGVIHVEVVR